MSILEHLNDPTVSSVSATPTEARVARSKAGVTSVTLHRGSEVTDSFAEMYETAKCAAAPLGGEPEDHTPALLGEALAPTLGLQTDVTLLDSNTYHVLVAHETLASGATVTVSRKWSGFERIVKRGTLNARAAAFLRTAARRGASIVICGGTGSGRSTMYHALLEGLAFNNRAVSIESPIEVQLRRPNVIQLDRAALDVNGPLHTAITTLALTQEGMVAIDDVLHGEELVALRSSSPRRRVPFLCTLHAEGLRLRDRLAALGAEELYQSVDIIVDLQRSEGKGVAALIAERRDGEPRVLWEDGAAYPVNDPSRDLRRKLQLD